MNTDQKILDCFCTLALESDSSDAQLIHYACTVLQGNGANFHPLDVEALVADLKAMTATEYMACVKRHANGNAISTTNHGWLPTLRSERRKGCSTAKEFEV